MRKAAFTFEPVSGNKLSWGRAAGQRHSKWRRAVTGQSWISSASDSGMMNLSRKWRKWNPEGHRSRCPKWLNGQPKDDKGGISRRGMALMTLAHEHQLLRWPSSFPDHPDRMQQPEALCHQCEYSGTKEGSCRPCSTWRIQGFGSSHHNHSSVLLTLPWLHAAKLVVAIHCHHHGYLIGILQLNTDKP